MMKAHPEDLAGVQKVAALETAAEQAMPGMSHTSPAAVPTNLSGYPTVDKIRTPGRLIVGGSATSMLLAARNPISGRIEGFDVDLARQVAKAIFGDPDKIERRVVTTAERIPVLQDGSVDLVISAMTINCARWQQIAFSAAYYRAGQKVLVPLGSKATSLDDLGCQRVCAPAASTSLDKLKTFPEVKVVAAATHTGCLVKFPAGPGERHHRRRHCAGRAGSAGPVRQGRRRPLHQ
jgi:polar amino acid transport system substrate-binding protein